MKSLFVLLLFVTIQAAAQKTPVLLQGGAEKPSFTYNECYHKLQGKDRYCNQYDYTYYIVNRELIIVETKTSHSDQPKKKSVVYTNEYRVKIEDIAINLSLDGLKSAKETYRIKNMEGSEQRFLPFQLQSKFTEGIKTTERGNPVGKERITIYADSYTDARDFLEYLLVQ